MAYAILEQVPRPVLYLSPTTEVHSGSIRIGPSGMVIVQVSGAPAEEFSFYVQGVPPLPMDQPEPEVWAEAYVVLAVIAGDSAFPLGVQGLAAGYVADPRSPGGRWLMLKGLAYAMGGLVIGYRVTIQRPVAPELR